MADSIITNLVQLLSTFALDEYKFLKGVGDQLNSLENELRFMKKFLRNAEGKQREHLMVSELVDQIKEVAFEAEDTIEMFLLNVERQRRRSTCSKLLHSGGYMVMHSKTANRIDGIKTRINEIYDNKEKFGIEIGDGSMNPHFEGLLRRRRKEVDEEMVGFEDVANTLLKQLTQGDALEIISIVGMGGLGKTTVAKRLYNNRIIKDHFGCHAWVSVSEDYNTHQIILHMLNRVAPNKVGLDKLNTVQLVETLKGRLNDRKFIIFLDDIWQPDMWDEVKACFPNKENGSRIVITSRVAKVAMHASPRKPNFLRFFTPEESWELFERKVFRGDAYPSHLKSLGKKIVKRCKGLPLSIVVIASMLASEEKSERIWERTLKDVSVHLGKDNACMEILALSYHHLPVELKPCFLYFAAFPEDEEMSVRRLITLWLAEGFVQPSGDLSLEEVAESYLDVLIDRSLVQAGRRRMDGGHKTCRIHDLIRDVCIREARSENFMQVASKTDDLSSTTSKYNPRRLSVHRHTKPVILSKGWDPCSVRAFLSFESQSVHAGSELWKTLHSGYKLLKVLDLGVTVEVTTLPSEISSLANLRYLRFFLCSRSIPKSVFNLWNLQMLFIKGNQSLNVSLGELLKLQQLKQLVFRERVRIYGKNEASTPLSKKQLKFLQVLSPIYLDEDFECAVTSGLCPSLRKVSVCITDHHCWSLNNLFASLSELQTLKISSSYIPLSQDDIFSGVKAANIPLRLAKLTLKSFSYVDDLACILGQFPNLRMLKLVDVITRLDAKDGSFPRLHTLHMHNFDEGPLWVNPRAFAELRYLFIRRGTCRFDEDLFKLPNLTDVEVLWPEPRLATTLKRLQSKDEIKYRLLVHDGE
ncbi:hypothetical protein BVRB_2g034690 [Beta vulgaris subsp. vulgaris]|nr:hypothetical protein BVRB_2g034690 [Beta vulgaris subsp. vulgaris]